MNKTLAALVLALSAALATGLGIGPVLASDEELRLDPGALSLRLEPQSDGTLVGTVQNSGATTVRDVRLLIRHIWMWKNERHPGAADDNPGRSAYYVVSGEVPANGQTRFRYVPQPPLPVRADGTFSSTAEIVGFTEVPAAPVQ